MADREVTGIGVTAMSGGRFDGGVKITIVFEHGAPLDINFTPENWTKVVSAGNAVSRR